MGWRNATDRGRLRRLFLEGFSVMDVAEPLVSFDAEADAPDAQAFMQQQDFDRVGVRVNGLVSGYVRREDLTSGTCGDHLRVFTREDDLVPDTASLVDAVKSLAINQQCFVTILDRVGAILTLDDLEKPAMRMFLFGIVTLGEMLMTDVIRARYPDTAWQDRLSPQRLDKARQLQEERMRRGQKADLIECLQYGDKGWILSYDKGVRDALGFGSRRDTRKVIKGLEKLRNNLAHTQEIIPGSWERIVFACSRLEDNLMSLTDRLDALGDGDAEPP